MPLIDVIHSDPFRFSFEEFDPKEWFFFVSLREVSEEEIIELRELAASYNRMQNLLAEIYMRQELDVEELLGYTKPEGTS